ncbi:ras-related protein Rab-33B-like [Onthophagus taurus]|uniref:ras-related protein Rab-33B-like n=1 Tax=Onthophagus taurus TaxID=166361 RepID=UPI000C209A1D|nr:ras-related protein Rab-33B-like isoform X1 [Onthophagus taurus]XP_022900813.1 ras-related protein Rab-33B-like isoform X2 [Onthophagus taurus]
MDLDPSSNIRVLNSLDSDVKTYKVIVLGDAFVGKTTLSYRFCEGKVLSDPESTIGLDYRQRVLNLDGEEIKLQLWDTAGQERFRNSLVKSYYRNADAIVFVYDVSDLASFDEVKKCIEEVNLNMPYNDEKADIIRILIGNKCDLPKAVSIDVAIRFADEHYMPYFETSANADSQADHIEAIFITLGHKLKNKKPMMRRPKIDHLESSNMDYSNNWYC